MHIDKQVNGVAEFKSEVRFTLRLCSGVIVAPEAAKTLSHFHAFIALVDTGIWGLALLLPLKILSFQ